MGWSGSHHIGSQAADRVHDVSVYFGGWPWYLVRVLQLVPFHERYDVVVHDGLRVVCPQEVQMVEFRNRYDLLLRHVWQPSGENVDVLKINTTLEHL